ncbi:MAG TPA: 5-(carboxyamino)imidazole ribonucleotide mutase [Balneolaceae bacterium]|nr:5-(carboxyamino)imidazole ribonucleotide mutase [Balneolaceae bacterium]
MSEILPRAGIVMGSDSDWPTMKEAADLLAGFELPYEKRVVSAHRTPDLMAEYGKNARERGIEVIIAGAGGAAHLPGMLASYTTLPVIGVPIQTSALGGIDSLYSIVQMPNGIPVATVAIGKAANAALLALRILSITDKKIAEALEGYHANMARESIRKTENLV